MKLQRHDITEAVLAAALILGPAITIGIVADVKVGSIGEWVAALATVGALVAAIYAGKQAAEIVDVERKRDRERDEAARRAQADQVAAWGIKGKVFVLNSSNVPVYNVKVVAEFAGTSEIDQVGGVPPTTREARRVEVPRIYAKYLDAVTGGTSSYPRMSVSIEFHDAAGAHWRRDARGTLTPLNPIPRDL